MKKKNWLFYLIIAIGIGFSSVKRLNSVMNPHQGYIPQSEEVCSNFCSVMQDCMVEDSKNKKTVALQADGLKQACQVLCRKGHPKFSECKNSTHSCSDLKTCVLNQESKSKSRNKRFLD